MPVYQKFLPTRSIGSTPFVKRILHFEMLSRHLPRLTPIYMLIFSAAMIHITHEVGFTGFFDRYPVK